jgi:hypothetical protein
MAINVGFGFFLVFSILALSSPLAGAVTAAPEAVAPETQKAAVSSAVTWLMQTSQNPDGGFGIDFGTGQLQSSAGTTLDAMLAIAASGESPAAVYSGNEASATDYLLANMDALTNYASFSGGGAGKAVLALVAANQNPRAFGGTDWVAYLAGQLSPSGTYNTLDAYNQSLAMMAILAVHELLPAAAVDWLKDAQDADGSWDDGFGTDSCSDATAMAIMALLAADMPVSDPVVVDALAFLADTQLESGGWEYGPGYGENANSTALVIQALSAAGEDFYSGSGDWAVDGRSPLAILLDWQSESGAFTADFGQGPADNLFATLQAIPGATGKPFPLAGRYEANQRALLCLAELQDETSGGWEQFGGFGVNAAGTSRAVEAIRAAGGDPQGVQWTPGAVSAVDALAAQTPSYLAGGRGGRAGIVSQGVVAAGPPYTPLNFAGINLPEAIDGHLAPEGDYADTAFGYSSQSEAMLGLLTAGARVDDTAVALLLNAQKDGDWGSPDGNGIVLNVLGRLGIAVPAAITNLQQTQQEDAGWGYGLPADPSATSEIVQGLVQSGQNPFGPAWSMVIDGRLTNAADTIMNQQLPNGCWPNRYAAGDDPFGTTDAMVMLAQQVSWQSGQIMLPIIVGP